MLVSCVHPVAILRAVFCIISMLVSDALGDHMVEHQTNTACAWLMRHSQGRLCKLYPSIPPLRRPGHPVF